MSKDINIHVKTNGTEQAKARIDSVAQSAQDVGNKAEEGGRTGAEGLDQLAGSANKSRSAFSKLFGGITGWAAKFTSITAAVTMATMAIRENIRAMEEHAQLAEAQQKKLTRLQFLGSYYEQNPELRQQVIAYSEYGRRPFEEVAGAWYNLRSKSGALSDSLQGDIMTEALELGKTDTEMPLDTLVDMFTLYAKSTGETDANKIQNVLKQTITEAGGGGQDVARLMPKFLSVGMSGGLTGAEAAGLWSYATTKSASPEIATTGLQATFMGLQGKGTPEGAKLLEAAGLTPDSSFVEKISRLSEMQKSGQFTLGMAEQIAGREGASIFLELLKDPEAMMRTMSSVVSVDRSDIDLAAKDIEGLFGQDERARLTDEIAKREIGLANKKANDINAMRFKKRLLGFQVGAEGELPPWQIAIDSFIYKLLYGIGEDEFAMDMMEAEKKFQQKVYKNDIHYHNDTIYQPRTGPVETGPRVAPEDL